jgi:hypothetical protein
MIFPVFWLFKWNLIPFDMKTTICTVRQYDGNWKSTRETIIRLKKHDINKHLRSWSSNCRLELFLCLSTKREIFLLPIFTTPACIHAANSQWNVFSHTHTTLLLIIVASLPLTASPWTFLLSHFLSTSSDLKNRKCAGMKEVKPLCVNDIYRILNTCKVDDILLCCISEWNKCKFSFLSLPFLGYNREN